MAMGLSGNSSTKAVGRHRRCREIASPMRLQRLFSGFQGQSMYLVDGTSGGCPLYCGPNIPGHQRLDWVDCCRSATVGGASAWRRSSDVGRRGPNRRLRENRTENPSSRYRRNR